MAHISTRFGLNAKILCNIGSYGAVAMGMKRLAVALVTALALGCGTAGASHSVLPGARVLKICAAAGPFWPTMTLALDGGSAWIACKEQSRVIRVSVKSGKRTKTVRLGSAAIAVRSGLGSIWALGADGTLYRLSKSGKVTKRIGLRVNAAYNIWIGGGSVWVADDRGAQVVRVSPARNRVVARVDVGDGPASMAFDDTHAYVVNHRDRTLDRIDLATNRPARLATLAAGAPERMVWLDGSLWITGRGTDLLQVNPADGSIRRTVEIGAGGIDVVAARGVLWVPTRSEEVDPSGFPTMNALRRVDSGRVSTVTQPTSRLDVHGLVAADAAVWIADNRRGLLYRVPA
jgi:hypothetical protein